MDNRFRRTIDKSLPAIPSVLISLIFDYAWPVDHIFTAESADVIDGIVACRIDMPAIITTNEHYVKIEHTSDIVGTWYAYVSGNCITSRSSWTVGWNNNGGRCVVGVSLRNGNFVDALNRPKPLFGRCWLLRRRQPYNADDVCDSGRSVPPKFVEFVPFGPNRFGRLDDQLDFDADPATLTVFVRVGDRRIILMTAGSLDEFRRLRPTIAVSGRVTVFVAS